VQEVGDFAIERFRPALDRNGIIDTEWAEVGPHLSYDAALIVAYALNPLVLYERNSDGTTTPVASLIANRVSANAVAALSLFEWLELGLDLPLTLLQSRDVGEIDASVITPSTTFGSFGTGDLRVAPKLRLIRVADGAPVNVALMTSVTLPTGFPQNAYLGDGTPTFVPELLASRALGSVRLAGNLAYRVRKETAFLNLQTGQELGWRLGAAWGLHDVIGVPLELDASASGSTHLQNLFTDVADSPIEVLGGASFEIGNGLLLFADVGTSLVSGVGTPAFRALGGVRFAPRARDPDGDSWFDDADKCPTAAEDKDGFEDSDGCPDVDNDNDGILDVNDRCPLEAEDVDTFEDSDGCPDIDNDKDGLVDGDDKCPLVAEDKDGFEDADGCIDPDNDKDGVLDVSDQCRDVAGLAAWKGCPPPDTDKDGVADPNDQCVNVPGPAATKGCPDQDGDRIADKDDKCPDKPETYNKRFDDDGCPEKGTKNLIRITDEKIMLLESVNFDVDKATIQKRSFELLDQVAIAMLDFPELKRVRIEGHTSSEGDPTHNLKLSGARAISIKNYLVKRGVSEDRLEAEGFGKSKPLVTNLTEEGRRMNRRVEFVVVEFDRTLMDAPAAPAAPAPAP
jgi:outer membrane protein OmpA-like peptidoglycan-associated protein